MRTPGSLSIALCAIVCLGQPGIAQHIPAGPAIDAEVRSIMAQTSANGMAVAVIDHGKVRYVQAYGIRNANKDPLTTDTIMYGASLTKTVFAYTVMQLVDQGKLNLDTPIRDDLDQPLPSYGPDPICPVAPFYPRGHGCPIRLGILEGRRKILNPGENACWRLNRERISDNSQPCCTKVMGAT